MFDKGQNRICFQSLMIKCEYLQWDQCPTKPVTYLTIVSSQCPYKESERR